MSAMIFFFICCFTYLLLCSLGRYKVGRMEQLETSDQAKARGANSVSFPCCIMALQMNLYSFCFLGLYLTLQIHPVFAACYK